MLGKQTLTARASTLWPQAPPTLIIQMSPKGRLKQQQSEEPGEQMYKRVCFRKIPGEKTARLTHIVARVTGTWRKEVQTEKTEKEGGVSLTKFIPECPAPVPMNSGHPLTLGTETDLYSSRCFICLVARPEPQVGPGWPRKGSFNGLVLRTSSTSSKRTAS